MVTAIAESRELQTEPNNEEPIIGEIGFPTIEGLQIDNLFLTDANPDIMPEKLHAMFKTDGQVAGLWRLLTTPIRSSGMQVMKSQKDRFGKRELDFINSVLFSEDEYYGMRIPMEHVIATGLRMLIDGWSPHEMVWKIIEGQVRVEKLAYRSPRTITPKLDAHGEIEYYVQKRQNTIRDYTSTDRSNRTFVDEAGDIIIPRQKVLHFVYGYEWNSVFGRSFFLQAYYHFEKKHKLYYISHLAAQIKALRLRLVKSPKGADKDRVTAVVRQVSKLGLNTTLNIPDGYEVELPDLGNTGADNGILSLIQHHDSQMSKSVLSQVLDVGVEGNTGSFNLSSTHLDIFILNLELISQAIAHMINRDLIPKLIDWNFGSGRYPKVVFTPFDTENRRLLTNLFTRIAGAAKLNVSPEFKVAIEEEVSRHLRMDLDYETIRGREIDGTIEKQRAEIEELLAKIAQMEANAGKAEAETDQIESGDNLPQNQPQGN